jgi:hypothetical protein
MSRSFYTTRRKIEHVKGKNRSNPLGRRCETSNFDAMDDRAPIEIQNSEADNTSRYND